MSNRDMTLQVIVKLRDEMSRGLDGALRKITAWGTRAKAVFASVGAGIGALSQKIGALGIGAGIGLDKGLDSLVRQDVILRQTAVNLGLAGRAAEAWIKSTGKWAEDTAKRVGQVSEDVGISLNNLVGANFGERASMTMVPQVARVATAANADLADMTETAKVLFQSWRIGAEQMELALAKTFEAGRQGNFELKAMARYLPEIAPLMASVGSTGMGAVAVGPALLQVSKMGAGTEAEAATNFKNFLSKITAPDFKKNMKEAGIDVDAVLKDAAVKRIDPIEAILGKVIKVTGAGEEAKKAAADAKKRGLSEGDTAAEVKRRVEAAITGSKLGELLPDMQAKTFVATYLAHREEYLKIRDTVAAAGLDPLGEAFDTQMAGPAAKRRMAGEKIEQIGRRMGEAISGIFDKVGWVAEKLQGMIAALDQISPKIVDTAVQLGSLVGAITGAVFALRMLGIGGGAAAVAGGAATVAGVSGAVAGGGSGLGVRGFLAGAGRVGALARLGPVGAALGVVSLLGALGVVSGALQEGIPTTKEGMAYRLDAGPIDFATYERAWREQKAWRRDPEAARGHAMMRKGGVTLPDPIRRDPQTEPWIKIGKPDLSFEAITGNKKPDLQYMIGAAFAGFLKATGMAKAADKPAPPPPPQKVDVQTNVTVKVDGPGQVVSSSTTTTGGATAADRGPTVGRP